MGGLIRLLLWLLLWAAGAVAARPGYPLRSVREFGALGDGVADDTEAMQRALDAAGRTCIYFPPGVYVQAHFVNLRVSHSCLIAAPGAVLTNVYPGTSGYQNDGIRVGEASARDGGTGTGINIRDVYVSGFSFDARGRIGVWVVYGERVTVEDVSGAGQAVVAVGNDDDDECRDVTVRNVHRTGATTADWYTLAVFNSERFVVDGVTSLYSVGSQAVAITNSRRGVVRNVEIDQQDGLHDGIALLDSQQVRVERFRVRRARKGVVLYSAYVKRTRAYLEQRNYVGPGVIEDSQVGLHVYSRYNTVEGVRVDDVSTPLIEAPDARGNRVRLIHR